MADYANYKLAKEAFVSDNAGDTVWRINKVCWTAISTYQLWKYAIPLLPVRYRRGWPLVTAEYACLVLPLLLALTVFSAHPIRFNAFIYFCTGLCYLRSNSQPEIYLDAALNAKMPTSPAPQTREIPIDFRQQPVDIHMQEKLFVPASTPLPASLFQKSFVTVWRAHMMLMTIICILAVDFPVFPRSFGKCETWGTSLMDIGVGSFVFSLGLTSAHPLLRHLRTFKQTSSVLEALRRSAAVLALGVVRILSVKGTDYPEHVTEYGVHWNFFFTLGLLPVCGVLAEKCWPRLTFRTMAILITAMHQILLAFTPLQAFTLNDHRSNLFAQNKEGLVSFAGYLAIYLLGLDTGMYTLPPDPYFAYRKPGKKTLLQPKTGKLITVLFSYAIVWWSVFGILHLLLPNSFRVSRRLANSSYVFWTAAFNVSFLLLYLLVDQLGVTSRRNSMTAPVVFQALNKNGLVIFLLANILTGLVNMSIKTMYATDMAATAIMVLYTAIVIATAWLLRGFRLKL